MLVPRLLADQMTLLLETGKMDRYKFLDSLRHEGLPVPDLTLSIGCSEIKAFYEYVRSSTSVDMLLVKGANFRFSIDSLKRLGATRWLNDEVIIACLHLSDKLAFVRVGFSVPIHRQTQPFGTMPRPFERASKRIAEWHRHATSESNLVCFFPLLQHQRHFSLLEINEREGCIFHYDSISEGENADIKVRMKCPVQERTLTISQAACKKEFPQLRYIEKVRSPQR
jgi:hypothetical protein